MDLSRLQDLHLAMKLAGIHPKKGLGQHFLIDAEALDKIVAAADLTKTDTVLEIGPGLGVMTDVLATKAAKVVAVEADATLAELLQRREHKNLEVHNVDILDFNLGTLGKKYKVVANLPYYITAKILRLMLESPNPPKVMSLLVQKEVAERITAVPGKMSILALSVQYYAKAEVIDLVERYKFWPAPKVDSAILCIKMLDQPVFEAQRDKLFRLIKAGFGEKRKQLKNSLAGGLNISSEAASALLTKAKLPASARAQELSLAQWQALYAQTEAKGYLQ